MNGSGVTVEAAQGKRGEVNRVPAIVDGLQCDAFSPQSFALKHVVVFPGELSGGAHASYDHGAVVLRFGQACWIRTRRRRVAAVRGSHAQRLVRTLLVVLAAELVEAALLGAPVGRHRRHGLLLQGQVHALVASVLLRMRRLDALGHDAQLDPPQRQSGSSGNPQRGKGRAVVGANRLG